MNTYIALGDSMSIDLYADLDARELGLIAPSSSGKGAASLLMKNDDELWPEFRGRDLSSQGVTRFINLTADGATTHGLPGQVSRITPSDEPTLVTLTIGGNDLISIAFSGADIPTATRELAHAEKRLHESLARLTQLRPTLTLIATTVYDPTDRTWRLPGVGHEVDVSDYSHLFHRWNDRLRGLEKPPMILVADADRHFAGHGYRTGDRWYWPQSIIEPSARGASEIRRLWLGKLVDRGQ